MFKNYCRIAWRTLSQNKIFSLIKISGLSVGLTACMLILLYTKDEVSFDRFNKNKDHIFRIVQSWKMGSDPSQMLGITNAVLGEAFSKSIPEIQQYVRITGSQVTVKRNTGVFTETPLFADSNFFQVFSFPLLSGNPRTALKDLYSIVLSEDEAKKYFGTSNAVDRTIQMELNDKFENFKVSAVAENPPENSSIKFDMLLPFAYYENTNRNKRWIGGSLTTFLLLAPKAPLPKVVHEMQSIFEAHTQQDLKMAEQQQGITMKIGLGLQPITEMHLGKIGLDNGLTEGSDPVYSYILTCIAIFILLIACINFINFAIAQSLKRGKEIGIRKVVGSTRRQLIWQFLTESFIVSLIAFILGIFLTLITLPLFNEVTNKKLSLSYLSDGYLYAGYFLLLLVTSFLAGLYPSLVLSAFQPVKVLYGKARLSSKNYFTKVLVVFQFSTAIFLVICAVSVNSQLRFLLHTDPGYDSNNLVRISLPYNPGGNRLVADQFRSEMAANSSIVGITAKSGGRSMTGFKAGGKEITSEYVKIDTSFLPIFKIPVLAGRNFSGAYPADQFHSVIVNESFMKEAGWKLSNAVGQIIRYADTNNRYTVVGVIRDYHFASLKEKITPEALLMDSSLSYGEVWVKISPVGIPRTMSFLKSSFQKILPFFPYDYQFMNDINASNYETEMNWRRIINISSLLFIFISCMGLLGLVMLSIELRTKEIGIRKVLGAAVLRILVLVSREFLLLVGLGFMVAIPMGFMAVHKWLQNFPYHIAISWWIFPLAGILVATLALLSMCVQAIKAAIANPAKSLKTE